MISVLALLLMTRRCLFRIYEDRPGHVAIKYRNWSTDPEDLPKGEPLEIFLIENGEQQLPGGQPELVESDFNKKVDLDSIGQNICRLKPFLSTHIQWWEEFLKDPSAHIEENSQPWYLLQLLPLTQPVDSQESTVTDDTGTSALSLRMEKERSIPEVLDQAMPI